MAHVEKEIARIFGCSAQSLPMFKSVGTKRPLPPPSPSFQGGGIPTDGGGIPLRDSELAILGPDYEKEVQQGIAKACFKPGVLPDHVSHSLVPIQRKFVIEMVKYLSANGATPLCDLGILVPAPKWSYCNGKGITVKQPKLKAFLMLFPEMFCLKTSTTKTRIRTTSKDNENKGKVIVSVSETLQKYLQKSPPTVRVYLVMSIVCFTPSHWDKVPAPVVENTDNVDTTHNNSRVLPPAPQQQEDEEQEHEDAPVVENTDNVDTTHNNSRVLPPAPHEDAPEEDTPKMDTVSLSNVRRMFHSPDWHKVPAAENMENMQQDDDKDVDKDDDNDPVTQDDPDDDNDPVTQDDPVTQEDPVTPDGWEAP